MAWTDQMVLELRHLIGDLDTTPVYSDNRLQQLLAVAAQRVTREIQLGNTYTINISTPSITPDPTDPNLTDNDFTLLTCLNAACILAKSNMMSQGGGDLVKDNISEVDTRQRSANLQLVCQEICKDFSQLRLQIACGNESGRVILSPFRVGFYANGMFIADRRGLYAGFRGY